MPDLIREAIRDRALACGFDAVGFAEAHLDAEARAGLGEFIARGYHGDMGWLAGAAGPRRGAWSCSASIMRPRAIRCRRWALSIAVLSRSTRRGAIITTR